jgi:Ca2+-transporting ATPase
VVLASESLVPGDCVRLSAGDRIPADAQVLSATGALVDESILTGESEPLDKAEGDELFSGTLLLRGEAEVAVTLPGAESHMGQLAGMLQGVDRELTPLEKRLAVLGRRIAIVVVLIAVLLLVAGLAIVGTEHVSRLFLFAVALAVAAVPESLPAVITLALALGVERMADKKAVVRRLSAVEALGSVTVIATDKTGTLTENRMDVAGVEAVDRDAALRAMALANNAEPGSAGGDPLEIGMLRWLADEGVDALSLRQGMPRHSQRPFDAAWKYMRAEMDASLSAS